MLPERSTIDPSTENPALSPLDLMGTERSWGIYTMSHDYTPPDLQTQTAGSSDTDGDPVVQSRYGNRIISTRIRLFEPTDLAATNLATNPKGELVKKFNDHTNFTVLREQGTAAIPAFRGDFRDKHTFTAGVDSGIGNLAITFPTAGTFIVSLSIWIPSTWDGGAISLRLEGYAGSTLQVPDADLTKRDQWQRVAVAITMPDASDLVGFLVPRTLAMPSSVGTGVIYTDALQIEKLNGVALAARTNIVTNPWAKVNLTGIAAWFESPAPARIVGAEPATKYGAAITQAAAGTKSFSGITLPGVGYVANKPYAQGMWVKVSATGFYQMNFRKTDSSASVPMKLAGAVTAEMVAGTWYFWESTGYIPTTSYTPNAVLSKFTNIGGGVALNFGAGEVVTWGGSIIEQTGGALGAYFPTDPQLTAREVAYELIAGESVAYFFNSTTVQYSPTAYFDGDTPGCDWGGSRHGSASTRPAPDGTRFSRIYRDVMAKLDRISRQKTGTLRRQMPGFQPITFDLRSAKVTEAPQDVALNMKRAEIALQFEADPGGRTPEVQIGAVREELALPCLRFLAESVPGDLPGLGRLVVEDKQAQNQLLALWGMQRDTYDASANADLFYEAESRTPKGAAATAVLAGSSGAGSNTILHNALVPDYQVVMTTQASGGGAHLQHVGSYRVLARTQRPTANAGEVSMRLVWAEGDFARINENPEVVFGVDDREGRFVMVDLGTVDLAKVPTGSTQRWEGRILAKSTAVSDDIYIDCLYLVPVTEGAGEARGLGIGTTGITYLGYDPMVYTFGSALAAKVASIGGTWGGGGDVDDFTARGIGVGRVGPGGVSDVAGVGRYEWLSETKYTASAAKVPISSPATIGSFTNKLYGGTFLRYVDTNNWLMAVLVPGAESGGRISWQLQVYKKVAGAKTLLATTILRYTNVGEALANVSVTFAAVSTVWVVEAYDPASGVTAKLSGSDAVMSTTLKEGRLGIYHENQAALEGESGPMSFGVFSAWEPTLDEAIFASRQLEVRSDSVRRQDAAGATYGGVGYQGNYLRVPPYGPEKIPSRFLVKAARDRDADEGIDDIAATLFVQPRYLVAPPG